MPLFESENDPEIQTTGSEELRNVPGIALTDPKPDVGECIQGLPYERGTEHHCDGLRQAQNNVPGRFRRFGLNVLSRRVETPENVLGVGQ